MHRETSNCYILSAHAGYMWSSNASLDIPVPGMGTQRFNKFSKPLQMSCQGFSPVAIVKSTGIMSPFEAC